MMWANTILAMDCNKRRHGLENCPFMLMPETGKLLAPNEIYVRDRLVEPSKGWVECLDGRYRWCSPKSEEILFGNKIPKNITNPNEYSLNWLYSMLDWGNGFLFNECFYPIYPDMLELDEKENECDKNLMTHKYEDEDNSFNFAIAFRGHTKNHPSILTPGLFRKTYSIDDSNAWVSKSIYVANIIKELVYREFNVILHDIEAKGILQHYGIIRPMDITDVSRDVNIAKWFALNEYDIDKKQYNKKQFKERKSLLKAYNESSMIYQVIILQPPKVTLNKQQKEINIYQNFQPDVYDFPISTTLWNVMNKWSARPSRQKGFGLYGIRENDFDKYGVILSITEYAYHPIFNLSGWDLIGGYTMKISDKSYNATEDTSFLQEYLFPPENEWFLNLEKTIANNVEEHFQG